LNRGGKLIARIAAEAMAASLYRGWWAVLASPVINKSMG